MKSKKSALLLSFTSLLLCFAMLAGSTFAWFTDTATTGVNKIQAGNLDVKLEYKKSGAAGFVEANETTKVFDETAQWEPGHVEDVVLKVSNAGNLALKYKLGINIAKEVGSTNVYNNAFNLSDYINFAVINGDQSTLGRDDLVAAATDSKPIKTGYTSEDTPLYPKVTPAVDNQPSEKIVTLVVWMPKTVGNEANHKADAPAPSVELGINVVATQLNHENDSYGPNYDKEAPLPLVATRNELNTAITRDSLKDEDGKIAPVEVTLGNLEAEDIQYTENSSGYTGKGVMLGNTSLNRYNAEVPEVGAYSFTFKDGVINSAANTYQEPDGPNGPKDSSVYMLVPGNSDVVFENMTFNGVVSFDIQKYTAGWSNLNSLTFKNCTFNGLIVGTCPADHVTFDDCTFTDYTNANNPNSSNPIWWRSESEGQGTNANPIQSFTFINNTVTSTRPIKIERVGNSNANPVFTFKNNTFNISARDGDTNTKNMAINIGNTGKYTLIDDNNTIEGTTAALYTALLTHGENQYNAISGNKVLDGNGNNKTITAMVWKTTTNETFEMKTID